MDYIKILKRSLTITFNYRVLWVFGFLLALTAPRNLGNDSGGGNGVQYRFGPNDWPGFSGYLPQSTINAIIGAIIAAVCLALVVGLVFAVLRYVSQTSLIKLVDLNEKTGEKLSFRQGFRQGWSRQAFRLFLIDLLVGVAGFVVVILLLIIAAAPLLTLLTHNDLLRTLGIVTTVGLGMLVILFIILVAIAVSLVMEFVHRAAVLEDMGVMASLRRGFELVRQRLGDVIVMSIILFVINLVLTVLMIPLVIILLLAAVVVGGLPALLVGLLTSLVAQGAWPWVAAALIGLPVFLIVIIAPLAFVGGLAETYFSSTWTLVYREVLALTATTPETPAPAPSEPDLADGAPSA